MKTWFLIIVCLSSAFCFGQDYNKEKICRTDTISVRHRDLKYGETISYKAFECTQVSKIGIRLNIGFSSFYYNGGTKKWMGNHNAAVIGLALVYQKLNLGLNLKLATVNPKSSLVFGTDSVTQEAKLNPVKLDYFAGYSIDLPNNFSLEPHVGLTKNMFFVVIEKELNKSFYIPSVYGFTSGLTVNMYFNLKPFQFICLFIDYSYGFTDFKKVNDNFGKGYSEWSVGFSYKVFAKRTFHERLH